MSSFNPENRFRVTKFLHRKVQQFLNFKDTKDLTLDANKRTLPFEIQVETGFSGNEPHNDYISVTGILSLRIFLTLAGKVIN